MVSCKMSSDGRYVHMYYDEITCWQGFHILHAICAIVVSVIFVLISLIVTLTFYETKTLTANAGSRVSSRTDFFLILYKIVCIIMFAFFYEREYNWVLTFILIFGSTFNYFQCKKERPYYHEGIAILWNITNAVYLWVNTVLFVCMLLQDTSFSGGVQLFGLGVPLVAVVEYFAAHPGGKYLSTRMDSFSTGDECARFLRYVTYTIYNKSDKSCSMFKRIKGFA